MAKLAIVAVFAQAAAAAQPSFEYLCTIDTFAVIGADPDRMEVFRAAATRTPSDLAIKDTYVVRPGGVRESESNLLWADWTCTMNEEEQIYCVSDHDEDVLIKGYFHIDERGFFRMHSPTRTLLQIAVGACVKTA